MASVEDAGGPSALRIACEAGIARRALVVAAVVGTILNLIAQGDFVIAGQALVWWKVVLTYSVPYCVATYGAVGARRESAARAELDPDRSA